MIKEKTWILFVLFLGAMGLLLNACGGEDDSMMYDQGGVDTNPFIENLEKNAKVKNYFDVQGCGVCGDGVTECSEECDGNDLGGATCSSVGYGCGSLACTSICTFNVSGCRKCGDGAKNCSEQCDGNDLGGATCQSIGYDGGNLACGANCRFDTSSCYGSCGDGVCESGENCNNCSSDCGCGRCMICRSGRCDPPSSCSEVPSGCPC